MGQGGSVVIVNKTKWDMIRTGIHSYQMDAWNFPEKIEAGKSAKFYVEWSEGIFETKGDDAGEAYYKLGDKKVEFRMWDANKRNFTVTYIGFEGVNSTPQRVNWLHDGEMTILITQTYVNQSDWMSHIASKTPLNKLSIPGTHDTLTFDCTTGFVGVKGPYARTQNLNLWDQLCCGCRFFDIRIDENLQGCHGPDGLGVTCKDNLDSVMAKVSDFLGKNSREAIVMRIATERDIKDQSAFVNKIMNIIDKYKKYLWKRDENLSGKWPQLGDVRGKIVVLDDLWKGSPKDHYFYRQGYGYKYGDSDRFYIQDYCSNPNIDYKFDEIKKNIDYEKCTDKQIKVNYVSANGLEFEWTDERKNIVFGKTIQGYADYLNPKVVDYLNKKGKCTTGLLIFDYVTADIAKTVIAKNTF